ncbi:MAG TPA: molybdate ABC transporter substrate-binding protein [Mycobacteriales bacterium]|nr:molybdate ABC transporter substrate-binding protein [Mycobacteriales bacterium]
MIGNVVQHRRRVLPLGAALVAVLAVLAACGSGGSGGAGGAGGSGGKAAAQRTITVSAAASLTGTFTSLAHQFEASHQNVKVSLNFGGSAQLAQQIVSGAPVDVFASASQATMDQVATANKATGKPTVFVRNVLEIAVPPGNPAKIKGIADFGRDPLRLAVCLPKVPCGAAAQKIFTLTHVRARPDTFEDDVKGVLTKVELGEADAGLVYRTDVAAAGSKVQGIDFPEAGKVVNSYPIVAVSDSVDAAQFIAFVLSNTGRSVMSKAGFQQP